MLGVEVCTSTASNSKEEQADAQAPWTASLT